MHAISSKASLISTTFRGNVAKDGTGGAYFEDSLLSPLNLTDVSFEDNVSGEEVLGESGASALALIKTEKGYMKGVSFVGNRGFNTLVRRNAPGPTFLCQPGHYMPSDPNLPINGDFVDCERFPCAAGYFGPHSESERTNATCDGVCPPGHYCPPGTSDPLPCQSGTSNEYPHGPSEKACRPCYYGQFQPEPRSTTCSICAAGTYSSELGQAECALCPAGGYCQEAGAASALVWTACPAGTFNPEQGAKARSACKRCPAGTTQPAPGAISIDSCEACPAGTYSSDPTSPCIPCPNLLSSSIGSPTCSMCAEDYYLQGSSADLLTNPSEHCKRCPPRADCSAPNTTLESLGVPPGYWRASLLTARLYRCDDSDTCDGSSGSSKAPAVGRSLKDSIKDADRYCAAGHGGPRCELCLEQGHYFSAERDRCVACPDSATRFAIIGVAAVGAVIVLAVVSAVSADDSPLRVPAFSRIARRLSLMRATTGIQAKAKVVISFYQISATLGVVYGVRLHTDFTGAPEAFKREPPTPHPLYPLAPPHQVGPPSLATSPSTLLTSATPPLASARCPPGSSSPPFGRSPSCSRWPSPAPSMKA